MVLSQSKKDLLRKFVNFTCEQCHKHEDEVGKLQAHRINRKMDYSLRNMKMLCKSCHSIYHSKEFPHISK